MKILCWNVNGIRAVVKKGFWDWFDKEDADIVCLQETKAFPDQLDNELKCPMGYHAVWHSGQRPGYAGTVIFSKKKPISERSHFGELDKFHEHGRVVEVKFENFTLLNLYFPNGNPRADGTLMLPYKLEFYRAFLNYVNELREQGESVITCGDFNVCHKEIDIARPKENAKSIGFLPVERAELDRIVADGYVDVFRHLNPEKRDSYTWWSYRGGARERNVGWRIDYFFISSDLVGKIIDFEHQVNVMGSDHCPLKFEVDL